MCDGSRNNKQYADNHCSEAWANRKLNTLALEMEKRVSYA
jgi:hypothetical protein